MGRGASIAASNPWYRARIEAAKSDGRFKSRESAAELLDMSVSSLEEAETGKHKVMPPEKAWLMAERYGAPEMRNWYCLNECPMGKGMAISCDFVMIDRAAVKLTRVFRKEKIQWLKNTLQDIAMDGVISDSELEDLDGVVDQLKDVARIISELEIIRERRKGGLNNG